MNSLAYHALDAGLRELLSRVGQYAAAEFQQFADHLVQYKGENDPFSYVDVTCERMLREGCTALLPGSGVIAEELDDTDAQAPLVWVIDPIDGTANYTHGVPHFCISVALEEEGQAVMGYVYEPLTGNLYHAWRGQGAWYNGQPIRVSRRTLGEGLTATGFPYDRHAPDRDRHLALIGELQRRSHGIRRFGSAALDLAWVAAGRFDAFFEYNLKHWDVAAGILLVEEAGGRVTDFEGGPGARRGGNTLATNGITHPEMLEAIGSLN
ncbi:MAG: inositol monophosphatase family protein [Bacteroidia bacterium]|nr:inositol monophosphatase family protein [Bacteroidia bacterium]